MEIGPILRTLLHTRTRLVLIALEVALTLAISVNCVSWIVDLRRQMRQPSGLDEENILVVTLKCFAPDIQEEEARAALLQEDLRRLRPLPGVVAATAIDAIPLSGGGRALSVLPVGSEELDPSVSGYFKVDRQAQETLGIELAAGRGFTESDFGGEGENVLVTRKLADLLFPDGDALGKRISGDGTADGSEIIIGIVELMHNAWPDSFFAERSVLKPTVPDLTKEIRYLVRAEPDALQSIAPTVEEALLEIHPGRLVEMESLAAVKKDTYGPELAIVRVLNGFIVLLVFVTCLGILGLTSYSVTERTRQIGTRRALGATRGAVLRYFLVENLMVTGVGLAVGAALAYCLNYGLMRIADAVKIEETLLAGGMAALLVVGIAAALGPALRATRVPPVVATQCV